MNKLRMLAVLAATLLFAHCSDNPVNESTPPNTGAADSIASLHFQSLGDSLDRLGGKSVEALRNTRFDDLRDGFQSALTRDPGNAIAHLGLSIIEMLELNYDEEIWAIVDSLDAWGSAPSAALPRSRHEALIGRQFSLLVEVPVFISMKTANTFPPNVTIQNIQEIIRNKVIPALDRALDHLGIAERRAGTDLRIEINDNGVREFIRIDLGEILIWDAAVHALRTAFGIAISRDVDLYGPDGTYNWIDEMNNLETGSPYCGEAVVVEQGAIDALDYYWTYGQERRDLMADSLLITVLYYNFEVRTAFLSLRDNGAALGDAHDDLVATLGKLEAAAAFIRNRNDNSEERVVKLADLTDLDSDISSDPNKPNFAKNFDTLEDVIQFLENLFSGPVDFTEQLGPRNTTYSWRTNLSRLFDNPIQDWNDLLPFHRWDFPVGAWIDADTTMVYFFDNGGSPIDVVTWNGEFCEWVMIPNIGIVTEYAVYNHLNAPGIVFLDGPNGNDIDLNVERFPYFPDYTFNGIFPQMNRAEWLNLEAILR